MDASLGEETRNLSVPSDVVLQVQTDLNDLGFLLGLPDGIAGRQTASLIERFQLMYGYLPADGIIDEELISQMEREIQKRGG
jgi:peptidoglycan hydrolase-like protein with peptidoglycan-binding domain